ncbi:hypothetical protein [Bacillus sp. CECT 9360]|nr:hypothetical protein [Bacillus sp. CECT 9360]
MSSYSAQPLGVISHPASEIRISCTVRLMPVALVQDGLASTFATGRGRY